MTQTRVDMEHEVKAQKTVRRAYTDANAEAFRPYAAAEPAAIPLFAAVGDSERIVRFTTSTHDERGILTKKPAIVGQLNSRLYDKVQSRAVEFEMARYEPQDGAQTLVVSFGVTARAMHEAVAGARAKGERVSMLIAQSLFPVPAQTLARALGAHRRVVVPELNHGQYRLEIERVAFALDPRPEVIGINRVDGELITPEQIRAAI